MEYFTAKKVALATLGIYLKLNTHIHKAYSEPFGHQLNPSLMFNHLAVVYHLCTVLWQPQVRLWRDLVQSPKQCVQG